MPDFYKFVSPHPDTKGKGGVIVGVKQSFLDARPPQRDWDHTHHGRVARLRLPSAIISEAIVSIYVVHLEGEQDMHQEQISLIAELKRVLWDDESDLIVVIGDTCAPGQPGQPASRATGPPGHWANWVTERASRATGPPGHRANPGQPGRGRNKTGLRCGLRLLLNLPRRTRSPG